MPEAGWLLLLLFLGLCSLIVVAILWPSFRRAHHSTSQPAQPSLKIVPVQEASTPVAAKTTLRLLPDKTPSFTLPEWLAMVNEHPDEAPHTLIVGTSGTGKTTIAQAIAATRTRVPCDP